MHKAGTHGSLSPVRLPEGSPKKKGQEEPNAKPRIPGTACRSMFAAVRASQGAGGAPREERHVSCLIKILEQKALCQGSLVAHLLGKLFS